MSTQYAPISKEQIEAVQAYIQELSAKDPRFSRLLSQGKIRFAVRPGVDKSTLIMINTDDPVKAAAYKDYPNFRTPQEAEHYSAGFGNEPTREDELANAVTQAVTPHYQYQIADPLRSRTRSAAADVIADALSDARYTTPLLPIIAPGIKARHAALGNLGLGLASRALSPEDEKETAGNLAANAATTAASVAGNRYFSKEALRKRQLKREIADKLGVKPAEWDPGLLARIEEPLKAQSISEPLFTYKDWRNLPYSKFDDATYAPETPLVMAKPLPAPVIPAKGNQIVPRRAGTPITSEIARDYANKLGTGLGEYPLSEVKDVLAGWTDPQSDYGVTFFPNKKTRQPLLKKNWSKAVSNENNEFAKKLYREAYDFEDPEMSKQWSAAKAEGKKRSAKVGNKQTPVVTQTRYNKMGEYGRNGNAEMYGKFGPIISRLPVSTRGVVRGAATLLPLAINAFGPYLYKKVKSINEESD